MKKFLLLSILLALLGWWLEGFVLLSTQDGLNKYDGYKFTAYKKHS